MTANFVRFVAFKNRLNVSKSFLPVSYSVTFLTGKRLFRSFGVNKREESTVGKLRFIEIPYLRRYKVIIFLITYLDKSEEFK